MRTKFYTPRILAAIACLVFVTSCDKSITVSEQLTPLKPADIDKDAGDWSMIYMSSPTQISVPVPADINSDAYKAELASLKDIQSKLNQNQRNAIEYWSGGGVLRWNQIFRELVARYNLPPSPNADGTYPAPDAENPFNNPQFPFSNPPYASRSYAYVSATVYDALKAAWYYKRLYNRPAPYKTDSGVTALMPQTDLPAYPSEDAVMSGAAAEMLKVLFPAAVEEITLKAGEQRSAALWSGKATSSDIAAGLALGKSVADLFKSRAATDGMKGAIGTKQQWADLKKNATSRGDTAWVSLETPPRPPMLPFFSKVTPFKMTTDDIVALRPGPPPLTSTSEMNGEVEEVKWYSNNLTRERLAIVHKWADGVGTYTPAGHWNDIAEEHIADANFSEVRAARAFALLNMTMHNAAVACWDTKFFYFNPRPCQLDGSIKTGTGVPNFPAYVSGHSTFSASGATILSYLFPDHAGDFDSYANEASMSRLYAGIHYRSDCTGGLKLGKEVGNFLINNFAKVDGAD